MLDRVGALQASPGGGIPWQAPGFAALGERYGWLMGEPSEGPRGDAEGNVWQHGAAGRALWVKAFNRNYWLGRDGQVRSL